MEIRKLLVANRGEIALRVFRTARELGIATVAVVAPDDAGSLHARSADETVEIHSYLWSEEHIRAAKSVGADAIHPGYGFLAESGAFARAVEAAGLLWIGPPPEALDSGGDKLEAKRIAREVGVPVVPDGDADDVGFPLLVKAAAGGGGRGMRVVRNERELDDALAAARREAKSAFGDDRVYLERYLERPRHVEIQLLADTHGNVVSLGERDCSVQRRHQKVLEESPSPAVDAELRGRIGDAAVRFARAIGYVGAGTAEFVLDGDEFYFLELNARIQVEHPVTEAVTGLDLVAEQIRIARGEPLTPPPRFEGHAVEVRLYAEDPRTFLPQSGRVERLRLPRGVRVDAGVAEGDEVGTSYDPMIAKLIAHGATRGDALDRLGAALADTDVGGVVTNLPFLRWLVAHHALRAGEATTAFLVEHPPLSQTPPPAAAPWRTPFRLNLPAPPPAPPPDIDALSVAADAGGHSSVTAPMPGTVLRVLVQAGDDVGARQPLVVIEAMKMETPLVAPYAATVREVHVQEGDRVAGGALLVELSD
ncbi:MAG: ATP-grasp domain-containing protein [Actinobacteria bacterium]|nr:ATP-grasp domain-containing protein [Actinomycetota bacterium]MBV8396020.1 ATP-grasp domain-containing protein [Actinomycetota bacterium]MBV8598591.1 ATP-grasp domain-containing protein [Actinomycetota bacterium]